MKVGGKMEKMQLVVCNFEEYREKFSPWSIIYITLNKQAFPDNLWWDVSSSILEMWARNLNLLVSKREKHCVLYFMDGDYRIELTLTGSKEALATCLNPKNEVVISDTIDLLHFARQLLAAIGKIQKQYFNYSNSRTLQNLTYEAAALRKSINYNK